MVLSRRISNSDFISKHRSVIIMSTSLLFTPIIKYVINTGNIMWCRGWSRNRCGQLRAWHSIQRAMATGDGGACNCVEKTGKGFITIENMNPCLKRMEYAVRGPIVMRALEIEKELQEVR